MYKTKNLLAIEKDAKTYKGMKKSVLTGVMYLAPHTVSGFQVCPKSTPECRASCLYTAGRGAYNIVKQGRINKTLWFFNERETFMQRLVKNIESLKLRAKKRNATAAVRLNGTSDIAWEKIACARNGRQYRSVMDAFPDVQFYDYTKITGRSRALALPNYHLTFSLSENNDQEAIQALAQGYNVAVVMRIKPNAPKPALWSGYPVIDGDIDDVRFRDNANRGHIVALAAKGEARKAKLGFVRSANGSFAIPLAIAA